MNRETHEHTQTNKHTGKQTNKQTNIQTDTQTIQSTNKQKQTTNGMKQQSADKCWNTLAAKQTSINPAPARAQRRRV